jgi:hypothetical protein
LEIYIYIYIFIFIFIYVCVSISSNHKCCIEGGLINFNYKRNLAFRIILAFFPSLVANVLRHNQLVEPGVEGQKITLQPLVEVSLVLHVDGTGAGADVCQDRAFSSSFRLVLLPTPLKGEAVLEVEAVPKDLVLELGF